MQHYSPSVLKMEALPTSRLILEFGANDCSLCQAARANIDAVLAEALPHDYHAIADGKGVKIGRAFGVKLWPSLIILENGEEKARIIRPTSQDALRQTFADLGWIA